MVKRISVLILLSVLVAGVGAFPAMAQEPIRVISEEMENHFPDELFFHIEVEGPAKISRIELFYRLRGEDANTIAPLEFESALRVQAFYRWYTKYSVIPPGAPILYYWKIEDEAGNTLTTEERVFYYDDVRFNWQTLADDEVAVFWYDGEDEFGRALYNTASTSLRELEEGLGAHLDFPIRVVAYSNREDFRSAFPPMEEWVGGSAFPSTGVTVQIIAPWDYDYLIDVIPHEICHLLFYQLTDNPHEDPPAWLNEGLAVHSEWKDQTYYDELIIEAVALDELLPMAFIVGSFPADRDRAILAYAQSYHLVKTLIEEHGWAKMGAYLQAFKAAKTGFDDEAAFEEVYGLPLMDFVNNWRVSLGAEPEPVPTPFPTLVPFGPRTAVPTSPAVATPSPERAEPTSTATTEAVPTSTAAPSPGPAEPPMEEAGLPAWFYPVLGMGIALVLGLLLVLFVLLRRRR